MTVEFGANYLIHSIGYNINTYIFEFPTLNNQALGGFITH